MNANGFVLHRKRTRHKRPRAAFVEVERGDGSLVLLLFGDLREMGETPAAVIDAMIRALDRCARGERVGDEGPVGTKFVHDGAQQLVLHGRPRPHGTCASLLLRFPAASVVHRSSALGNGHTEIHIDLVTGNTELNVLSTLVLATTTLDVHHVTLFVEVMTASGGGGQKRAALLHRLPMRLFLGLVTSRFDERARALALVFFPPS